MTAVADDIITVVARLANGFAQIGLPKPEAIVMKTHDDGMRLYRELQGLNHGGVMHYRPGQEPGLQPVEGENGAVYMEAEVYGMKIRWPAEKWPMPRGGWRWG